MKNDITVTMSMVDYNEMKETSTVFRYLSLFVHDKELQKEFVAWLNIRGIDWDDSTRNKMLNQIGIVDFKTPIDPSIKGNVTVEGKMQ